MASVDSSVGFTKLSNRYFEDTSIEIIHTETQRAKTVERKKSIQELWDNTKCSNTRVTRIAKER